MERRAFLRQAGACLGIALTDMALGEEAHLSGQRAGTDLEKRLFPLYEDLRKRFPVQDDEYIAIIDGERQRMYLVKMQENSVKVEREYTISTGKPNPDHPGSNGFSNQEGSNMTPLGIHRIYVKGKDNVPKGGVFDKGRYRGYQTKIYTEKVEAPSDLITTRLIMLEGCEEQNKDSLRRGVFIHGTNEEGLLGEKSSHGCIRMKNDDVIEFYKLVNKGNYVYIKDKI